ncbi:MAG: F0F1 ATP synthase subunit epsilon [Thiohalomonadales bacterium]
MTSSMKVDIVSAEAEIYSGTGKMLFAPAVMGDVGVMPQHTPLLTKIKPGQVKVITEEDEELLFFVSGGMLEILPQGVTILADTAHRADHLDEAKALAAKERVEKLLADRKDDIDYAAAESELHEAVVQLKMIKNLKKKLHR